MQWYWILLIAVAAAGVVALIVNGIRQAILGFISMLFGGRSASQALLEQATDAENTPKSVSSMTRTYLPRILSDFPAFNWNEYRQKAANVLKSALLTVNSGKLSELTADAGDELRSQIRLTLEDDEKRGVRHYYQDVAIHRTEIIGYKKEAGTCVVTLQSSVGCLAYELDTEGNLVSGSNTAKRQTRYNLELLYVQDEQTVREMGGTSIGMTCRSCGAPIGSLGQKVCPYCGTGLTEINVRVWSFGRFYEIDRATHCRA